MHNWLSMILFDEGPKYAAISDALSGAIRSGELRPGERLPTQREIAEHLGVDLTTVTRAYGLVRQAGLIEGAGKLGSFVRNDVHQPVFDEALNQNGMNVPPQPAFNLLSDAIRTGTLQLLRAGRHSPILQYQPSMGNPLDRKQAAASLSWRGIPSDPDQIVITSGSQNALHGIVAGLLKPGERLCCAPYLYPGMIMLAKRHGLELCPVAVDDEGLIPDALEQYLSNGIRYIYLTPTNDNPTTLTMGTRRREAIAELASRYGSTIFEDDAYGLLPSAPELPIAAIAPECTWYIAGTSKVISPVIRVAHVRAPSRLQAAILGADISRTTVMAPPLNAALVTMWQGGAMFDQLVAGVRLESIQRQRIVRRYLADFEYAAHPEGYHIWLKTSSNAEACKVVDELRSFGLSVVPGSTFLALNGDNDSHVRISIGGAISQERLERALIGLVALKAEQN